MILRQYPQIIEILEIPQLMDTCVKSNMYEEALDLESFAMKMKKLHPDIPLVQELVIHI
jgi:hypothetical protein